MTIAMPLLINTVPLDEMMNMFIFGGVHQPVAIQVAFTHGITLAFWISSAITIFAIIVSALRGTGDMMRGVQA